jgi:tRNA-splicing ligase RtcB
MRVIETPNGKPVKHWTEGVQIETEVWEQLYQVARLPFVALPIAVMPDAHVGKGSTIGTVVATRGAVVPAAVGVDIGCGMTAFCTGLDQAALIGHERDIRKALEVAVPHGDNSWAITPPDAADAWEILKAEYGDLCAAYPAFARASKAPVQQLGTLGGGNHFLEISVDEPGFVWIVLHTGSRGVGNRIGQIFTRLAREAMDRWFVPLSNPDLAYLPAGTNEYTDFLQASAWACAYAGENRRLILHAAYDALLAAVGETRRYSIESMSLPETHIDCVHNFVAMEHHFSQDVLVTRKGATRARVNEYAVIPGAMGAPTYIVRGNGNPDSLMSCSHGAGRAMSRTKAKATLSVEDLERGTEGLECRKDASVLDEAPQAYKSIEAVMAAQADLVEIVHTLRAVVCVKG